MNSEEAECHIYLKSQGLFPRTPSINFPTHFQNEGIFVVVLKVIGYTWLLFLTGSW